MDSPMTSQLGPNCAAPLVVVAPSLLARAKPVPYFFGLTVLALGQSTARRNMQCFLLPVHSQREMRLKRLEVVRN
jgi:hypothetical protein